MTSRTPIGVQTRPPQRTLSSSSLSSQRTTAQPRALSQQFLPASPARKDLAGDAGSDAGDRHGTSTPRRGGSRLRLELSNDPNATAPSVVESPQSMASSRALPIPDGLESAQSPALSRTSHQDTDNPPLPFPKRRQPTLNRTHIPPRRRVSTPPIAKKDGRPRPYVVEPPPDAPRLASSNRGETTQGDFFGKGLFSGRADFFPWTGSHHEDDWTTESIARGIFEKPNPTETNSARPAILPALKQKSGLQNLSTIFMGVLNQRRQRGQVTAPSTFKPPPRVTLTDTKREVWLKDLANPATPLRRLSRTIPHGVRGRALLDQCLNKKVPTERAVWLAKCVGANELRANKRKGVNGAVVFGGEHKWCRDWTIFVEQFVDSVLASAGEGDWKSNITYALRLATTLYSEQLLDRDHYLDWVISGLESSPQGKLPIWILIAQLYWTDLLQMRRYGRRLIFALLSQADLIQNDPDRDILSQLHSQLCSMLVSLLKSNPESFVFPSAWAKYRENVGEVIPVDDEAAHIAYANVNARNARLAVTGSAYHPAGRQQLVRLLDTSYNKLIDTNFASDCWLVCDDKMQLTKTLAEWATSHHRPGLSKIYVAASLFKSWHGIPDYDPTRSILEVVDGVGAHEQNRKFLVYHLVTELIRNRTFSVPLFLQWLIARGGFHDEAEIDPDTGSCATRLLVELPVYCLQPKWRSERGNLLRRAGGFSLSDEDVDTTNALKHVEHSLGLPLSPDDAISQRRPLPLRKLLNKIGKSSRSLKSTLGSHMRDVIARKILSDGVSPDFFSSVRSILETTEDFAMLSDVVRFCTKSTEPDVLAACVDTINSNLSTWLALGSAIELFDTLVDRLRMFRQQQGIAARSLLVATSRLASRLPDHEGVARHLRQELLDNDRSNAIDACSPVSDNMMAPSNQEGEVSDEIDRLLANGNRIDHPTMNRLFRTIIPKLEGGWAKRDESRKVYASSLTKMRVFDSHHFDKLMADWISHVRSLESRAILTDLFPLLVTTGCLSVTTLLHTANASPPMVGKTATSASFRSATYLQELLHLFLVRTPKSELLNAEELYQFGIQQESAKWDDPKAMLTLVRNVMLEYTGVKALQPDCDLLLDDVAFQDALLNLLKFLVVADPASATESLNIKGLPSEASDFISRMTTRLLIPGDDGSAQTSFDQILALAGELTLPFCQLKLNCDLSRTEKLCGEGEDPAPSRFEVFANAMDRAIEINNIAWTSMLPCLSADVSQHLKSIAQGRFLSLVPSLKSDTTPMDQLNTAKNLLGVIEAITAGQPAPKCAQLGVTLYEKLVDICEVIAAKPAEEYAQMRDAALNHWLPALLRLLMLQSYVADPTLTVPLPLNAATGKAAAPVGPGHEARARIILALCSLLVELQQVPDDAAGELPEQVLDVTVSLADALPDDLRQHCAKILLLSGTLASMSTPSDPRLYYILSASRSTMADNLVLSHRDRPSPMPPVRAMNTLLGYGTLPQLKLTPYNMRPWELLSESTPNVGENDTSLSLSLFESIKIQ